MQTRLLKSALPMLKPAMDGLVEVGDTIPLQEGEGSIALMIFKGPETEGRKAEAMLAVVAMDKAGSTIRRVISKGPMVETLQNLAKEAENEG